MIKRETLLDCFVFIVIGGSFFYLLSATWLKWGDLVVDTGRELWLPAQLLKGKVLYRDLFYEYGPLPPYVISLLYKVFGVHINTIVGCGIVLTIFISLYLYKLSLCFLGKLESGLVVVTFLFAFAFGYYFYAGIFNTILPYSFASVFFLLFAITALYFFVLFIKKGERYYLLLWVFSCTAMLLCRIELSFLLWGVFLVVAIILVLFRRDLGAGPAEVTLLFPVLAAFLIYALFLVSTSSWEGFYESTIHHILSVQKNSFNDAVSGMDNIGGNTLLMVKSLILHLFYISIAAGGVILTGRFRINRAGRFFCYLLTFCALSGFWFHVGYSGEDHIQYRLLPVIILSGAVSTTVALSKRVGDDKKNITLLSVFLVALVLLLRNFFYSSPHSVYGFYLLAVPLMVYYVFLLRLTSEAFRFISPNFSASAFSGILIVFFLLLIIPHWRISSNHYKQRMASIVTERGTLFFMHDLRTVRLFEAIDFLSKHVRPEESMVVIPEGVGVNFFTGRENPCGYYNFTPTVVDVIGEEKIVHEFSEKRPDYIVIVQRRTTEYGYPSFGVDYGNKINDWIKEKYGLNKIIGSYPFTRDDDYGIAVYKRRPERL